jgi:hypothetical protein
MIRRLVGNDFMDACYTFRAWYFRKCRRTWFEAVDTFRVIRFLVNRYEIVTVLVVIAIVYILLCGIASAAATHSKVGLSGSVGTATISNTGRR